MRLTRAIAGLLGSALLCAGCVDAGDERTGSSDDALSETLQVELFDHEVVGDELVVTLEVRNLAYDKRVGVRASVDGGDWLDVEGSYRESAAPGVELWEVRVAPGADWALIRYAAFYEDLATGEIYWDSNDGFDYLAEHYPAVRRIGQSFAGGVLTIDVAVRNLAYDKVCSVVFTGDDWITQSWKGGYYVGAIDSSDPALELWRIELDAADPSLADVASAAVLEYALVCFFDHEWPGRWDNNIGRNYRYDRSYPVTGTRTIDLSTVSDLEVAADGTVFAVAGGPWSGTDLEIYDPDGSLVAARSHGQTIIQLVHVEAEELVLVQTYGTWPERDWTAYDLDGTELWSLSGALETVVIGGPGEPTFLIGDDGGAQVTGSRPTVVGPSDRCARPVVTAGGRLVCDVGDEVQVFQILAGAGQHPAVYPDGAPWAADDDGHVVLLASGNQLRGYDADAELLWTASSTGYIPDHYLPTNRRCANRAVDGVVAYSESIWTGGTNRGTVHGVDIATGATLFSLDGDGFGGPCVYPDGRFYLQASHYPAQQLVRVDASGNRDDYRARGYLSQISIGADGVISGLVSPQGERYREESYVRLVVLDDQLVERFARTQLLTYPPGQPALDASLPVLATSSGDGIEVITLDLP